MEKFGIVNATVLADPELSLRAKGLYAVLCKYADTNRECFPSIPTLAQECDVCTRTIERLLKELKEKNYITRSKKIFTLC